MIEYKKILKRFFPADFGGGKEKQGKGTVFLKNIPRGKRGRV